MKKRDIEQLKNKPVPELQKLVSDSRAKLRKLRFDLAAGKVKNVSEIREVRKYIARTLTFIGQSDIQYKDGESIRENSK